MLVVLCSSCPLKKERRRTHKKNEMNGRIVREMGKKGEAATWTSDNKTRCDGSKPSDTRLTPATPCFLFYWASLTHRSTSVVPKQKSPIKTTLRLFEPAIQLFRKKTMSLSPMNRTFCRSDPQCLYAILGACQTALAFLDAGEI